MKLKRIGQFTLVAALVVLTAIFLFPMALTFANSFMTEDEITAIYGVLAGTEENQRDLSGESKFVNLKWIPERVTLSQYYDVLIGKPQFLFMFWNSVKITLPIITGQIAVASLAAYAFAHLRFRFREPLFFMYIVTMLMPFQVTLVPNFIIADKLGLLGSYGAIIFPGIFSAFGVFLSWQFMMFVPGSYIEAARVDGASHLYIFLRIVLPMCSTGVAALSILVFIDSWNMVEQTSAHLSEGRSQTAAFRLFDRYRGRGTRDRIRQLQRFTCQPLLLTAWYAEQYLVEGIQLSGIKG